MGALISKTKKSHKKEITQEQFNQIFTELYHLQSILEEIQKRLK